MKLVDRLAKCMSSIAPLTLADSAWDNVGILVRSPLPDKDKQSKSIPLQPTLLLCNDLTFPVVQEAISNNVSCILAYHPVIFRPALKSVDPFDDSSLLMAATGCGNAGRLTETIVAHCIANGISVYCPHTALDACFPGVNDWLLAAALSSSSSQLKFIELQNDDSDALSKAKAVIPCKDNAKLGYGRQLKVSGDLSIGKVVENLKLNLKLKHLRVALAVGHDLNTIVKFIGVCAGSGSSVLSKINLKGEEVEVRKHFLFVTGEMSHHELISATQSGVSVILCEHSNSERGYLSSYLLPKLESQLREDEVGTQVKIISSQIDRDPIQII